jgi:L-lactate dehydrogenase complex protein LldG
MNEILEKVKKYSTPLDESLSFSDEMKDDITSEVLIKKFEEEAVKIGSKVVICAGEDEAVTKLEEIISGYASAAFNSKINPAILEKIKARFTDKKIVSVKEIEEDLKSNLAKINVAVTIPEFLIAESGTTVIKASTHEPRLLSVLTDVSVVFAKKEQIIPSMSSFLKKSKERMEDFNKTSGYIFITGASRTADIEKILIIGVHGPGELIYIVY